MPDSTRHPRPADDAPITESEMLDWIDGRLSETEAARLEAASGRIGLRRRIGEMRSNRAVLAALPEETAPATLAERIFNALERDTLIGLSDGPALSDSLPISSVPSRHRHQRWWSHGRVQFAMAAGLALIAGGAAYWGTILSDGRAAPERFGGDLVLGPAQNPALISSDSDESSLPTPDGSAGALAVAVPAVAADSPASANEPSGALAKSRAHDESVFFETRSTVGSVVTDDARALALAREGRLVMRVIASNVRALPQVTTAAMSESSLRDWRLTDRLPATTVAMVMPRNIPFGMGRGEPALASAQAISLIGPRAMFSWTAAYTVDRASKVRGTFIAELPAKQAVLNAVRSVFADKLDASVVFEELAEAIPSSGAVDAAAALWWTRPSSQWVQSVQIPVVVEER